MQSRRKIVQNKKPRKIPQEKGMFVVYVRDINKVGQPPGPDQTVTRRFVHGDEVLKFMVIGDFTEAIKQQLEDMPLEEFEKLLKGVAVNKGHEGMPQHAELLSQLKHHVKVPPDEPLQSKTSEKDCRTFLKSITQRDKGKSERLSSSNASASSSSAAGCSNSNFNGNVIGGGVGLIGGSRSLHYSSYQKNEPNALLLGSSSMSSSSGSRCFPGGDQNANPLLSTSETFTSSSSSLYNNFHKPTVHQTQSNTQTEGLSEFENLYSSHYQHAHHRRNSTSPASSNYESYLEGEPISGGRCTRRINNNYNYNNNNNNNNVHVDDFSHHNDDNKPNSYSAKNSYNLGADDPDVEEHESDLIGNLPAQYILSSDTKLNKDLPAAFQRQSVSSQGTSSWGMSQSSSTGGNLSGTLLAGSRTETGIRSETATGSSQLGDRPSSASSASWDLQTTTSSNLQLNDGYRSVSSITSGATSSYMGRSIPPAPSSDIYGTVRSTSPTLPPVPPTAIISKSPSFEGSPFEKPPNRRAGDRKKKSSKNVLRETLINPEEMPGFKGNEQDIDKLLEFVEGNQIKTKKPQEKKKRDPKAKGNEKQLLSKAASLDENSLGYGSKKSDDGVSRGRNGKDIERKNSANITKSSTAICTVDISDSNKLTDNIEVVTQELHTSKSSNIISPTINGTAPVPATKNSVAKSSLSSPEIISSSPKSQPVSEKAESLRSPVVVPEIKSESESMGSKESKPVAPTAIKMDEEKFAKPDESDAPYVLVQSKKKREKKKLQQRESENFPRSHVDQARREGGRGRRGNTERRKSVGSVPGSENECSDDDDSVRSLPAGECTPRERIPKPCSSSGGTPQTSYADIARMSRDESGKPLNNSSSISLLPQAAKPPVVAVKPPAPSVASPIAVTSDSNFPALSPHTSATPSTTEKTAPVGATVWPCRRLDQDLMCKEKSPVNSKFNEEPSPTVAPSQQNPLNSIPPTCSSKLLLETNETVQEKPLAEKDTLLIEKTSSENLSNEKPKEKEVVKIVCNGTAQPSIDVEENEQSIQTSKTSSVQNSSGTKKLDDGKGNGRWLKVSWYPSQEALARALANKDVEDADPDIHTSEPVVFCGGKFDSTNLPVGQKIGFEFGFGVNEVLNDSNGFTESLSVNSSLNEFPPISTVVTGPWGKTKEAKFQERAKNPIPVNNWKSQNAVNDLEQGLAAINLSKNGPVKAKESDTVVKNHENSRSSSISGQATNKHEMGDKTKFTPSVNVEAAHLPEPKVPLTGQTENCEIPGQKIEKNPVGIGIAQMYMPPEDTSVPDSVLRAFEFMDEYATRLTNLSKQGKVSYHRVD